MNQEKYFKLLASLGRLHLKIFHTTTVILFLLLPNITTKIYTKLTKYLHSRLDYKFQTMHDVKLDNTNDVNIYNMNYKAYNW